MAGRCYVRNGVWGWSVEDQRKALAAAGVHDPSREFCDEIAATKAKRPSLIRPEWLGQRARLLKPTGRRRGEPIHVATLLALAVNEADLVSCLVGASERGDTVMAIDSGFSVGPDYSPTAIQSAIWEWSRAKRDAQTKPGRLEGMRVAAERRRAETMRKLAPARPLWRNTKPDRLSGEQIAEQVGLSVKTLYVELGRRPDVKKGKRG